MIDTDEFIVCSCLGIKVKDTQKYFSEEKHLNKSLKIIMEELLIAQSCGCCLHKNCGKIDIHITELINKYGNN